MLTFISFIFVLSLLVVVHELGHFSVAKIFGIGVERFSVGLPPRLFGKKIGETEYVVSAIPFGGYVKMTGQDDFTVLDEDTSTDPRDYRAKSAPVRIAVLVAGSFMNLVAAVVIFFFLFMSEGIPETSTRIGAVEPGSVAEKVGLVPGDSFTAVNNKPVKRMEDVLLPLYTEKRTAFTVANASGKTREVVIARKLGEKEDFGIVPWLIPQVGAVIPGSAADKAGLMPGDTIAAIDSITLSGWYDIHRIVKESPGRLLTFTVIRGGDSLRVPVTPAVVTNTLPDGTKESIGRIGVRVPSVNRKVGATQCFTHAVNQTWFFAKSTLDFFVKLVTGRMSPKLLGGPVMIASMAGESAKTGFSTLLGFTAFISINLGVLNLLPFPVLDGGHITIILAESVVRRKLSIKAKMAVQQAGTIVLLLFMFYVTFNDIMRIDTITRFFGGK